MPLVAWLCYRIDPRQLMAFGAALTGAGLLTMTGLAHEWSGNEFLLPLALQSSAAPFVAIPTMVLITEDLAIREIPWIASLVHIIRTIGSAVGVAAVGTFVRIQEQVQSSSASTSRRQAALPRSASQRWRRPWPRIFPMRPPRRQRLARRPARPA